MEWNFATLKKYSLCRKIPTHGGLSFSISLHVPHLSISNNRPTTQKIWRDLMAHNPLPRDSSETSKIGLWEQPSHPYIQMARFVFLLPFVRAAGEPWPILEVFNPYAEPREQDAFPPLKNYVGPKNHVGPTAEVPRISPFKDGKPNLEWARAKVRELVMDGQPVVVEQSAEPHSFHNFTCKDYADKWGSAKMRDEYDHSTMIFLNESYWYTKFRAAKRKQPLHLSEGNVTAAPYVWHIKDEVPQWMKKEAQALWKTPWWLNDSRVNTAENLDSFEMWFALPGGAVFAHADSYCEMTVSWQLTGTKVWRLMNFPPMDKGGLDRFDSFDEGIYSSATRKWYAEYEFTVKPGDVFIFAPNYLHETYVFPKDNDECTVASTFQFQLPVPARYVRRYYNRIIMSALGWEEHCYTRWTPYVTLGIGHRPSGKAPKPTLKEKEWVKKVDTAFKRIDVNNDKKLTTKELYKFFSSARDPGVFELKALDYGWAVPTEERSEMQDEVVKSRVAETMAYNDRDQDGVITRAELWESTVQVNVILAKMYAHIKVTKKHQGDTLIQKKSTRAAIAKVEADFEKYRRVRNPYHAEYGGIIGKRDRADL